MENIHNAENFFSLGSSTRNSRAKVIFLDLSKSEIRPIDVNETEIQS
jgi:hypothetical protein